MKNIIYLLTFSLIIVACDKKEATIISSFPFEVTADYQTNTFLNTPVEATFDIVPEQIVTTNYYRVSYRVLSGQATVILQNGSILYEDELYDLETLRFKPSITPSTIGEISVQFTFVDSEGETTVSTIYIESNDTSFYFISTGSLTNMAVSERLQISYAITEVGATEVDKYTLTFSSTANGRLTVNSVDYNAGEEIIVPSLNFIAFYTPSAPGEHSITSNITAASNNSTLTSEVNVSVEASAFTFSVTSNNEITVGDRINVEFTLNETIGASDFDISYALSGPEQTLKNQNSIDVLANTPYDVETNTFTWTLDAKNAGKSEYIFTATNQYGVSKSVTITYTVKEIQFDFEVNTTGTDFFTNEDIQFSVAMNAPSVLTYQMTVSSNADSFVSYSNTEHTLNNAFSVSNTNFLIDYNSAAPGSNIITFKIEASNGVIKTKTVPINIKEKVALKSFQAEFDSGECYIRTCTITDYVTNSIILEVTKDDTLSLTNIYLEVDGVLLNITSFTTLGDDKYRIDYDSRTDSKDQYFNVTSALSIYVSDSGRNTSNTLSGTLGNVVNGNRNGARYANSTLIANQ
ncbi:TraQ conjugal transfer family protein [Streptomyces diastaticus]|uniref:TraQ conjugal transfer family protein n=1 Tax=Streptomyces diastaticus TaxID=1956 RepID=UPI0037D09EDD